MLNAILLKSSLLITLAAFVSGCNNLIVANPLDEGHQYNEFLGHHYTACEGGEMVGVFIDGAYSFSEFTASVDDCESLNIISIEYSYIYDFDVVANSAPMAEGVERIVYRATKDSDFLFNIALRDYGFYIYPDEYIKLDL